MRSLKTWLLCLTALVLLSACSDGSVRSPGLIGPGALLSMEVVCRQNASGGELVECSSTRIPVPLSGSGASTVAYRVLGTFADGSTRDITDQSRIQLAVAPAANAAVRNVAPDKGRISALQAGPDGADVPVTITATDTLGEASPATANFTVFGRVPVAIAIANAANVVQPVYSVASGIVENFRVRITFGDGSTCFTTTPGCIGGNFTWTATENGTANNGVINVDGVGGRFRFNNQSTENTRQFTITVTPPSNFGTNVTAASAQVNVPPARFIPNSLELRLQPPVTAIPVEGRVTFRAFADFDIGGTAVEVEVTQSLTSLISDAPNFAAFEASPNRIDNVLVGRMQTPQNTPVTVTATFTGTATTGQVTETRTATVRVLEPDFAELALVPVGVAPFRDAGFFERDLSEEELADLEATIAQDAMLLGLTEDGRVPCSGSACPDGQLGANQTLPANSLAYAVFTRTQGQNLFSPDPLSQFNQAITCPGDGSTEQLDVVFAGSDEVIQVSTSVIDPLTGESVPTTTASGIRIVMVEGLTEGTGIVRARLGAGFGSGIDSGRNCRGEAVDDGEQEVTVGLSDTSIQATSFNINKNFTCVGFVNEVDLLEGRGIGGGEKLRSSLTYDFANGQSLVLFANQNPRVSFRTRAGPATVEGQACRNDLGDNGDGDIDLETDPVVLITNALGIQRGIMGATGVLALGSNCAAATFTPAVTPPGFTDESLRTRAATVVALPADDDIINGTSAISGEPVDGLCGALAPLLTLPVGQLLPGLEQGAGLPVELIGTLGALLSPILNNAVITGPVSQGLKALLDTLSEGLGMLFQLPLLGDLLNTLLGCGGILTPACPLGFSLLPTITDGLHSLLEEIRSNIPGIQDPPATVDPGDPFLD